MAIIPRPPLEEFVRRNRLINPSFEAASGAVEVRRNYHSYPGSAAAGTAGWAGYRAVLTNPGGFVRATINQAASGASGSTGNVAASSMVPVAPGESWRWSAEVRGTVATGQVVVAMQYYDSGLNYLAGTQISGAIVNVNATDWAEASVTMVAPAGAAYTRPLILINGMSAVNDVLDFRRVTAEKTAVRIGPPFDGGYSPDADLAPAWVGVADSSQSTLSGVPVTGYTAAGAFLFQSSQWAAQSGGSKSLRLRPVTGGASFVYLHILSAADAGKTITVLGQVRVVAPTASDVAYSRSLFVVPATVPATTIQGPKVPNVPGVHDIRWTFTLPPGTGVGNIRFYHGGAAGEPDIWLDNFVVVEGKYDGPYFDGNTSATEVARYLWDGAQNASTTSMYKLVFQPGELVNPRPIDTTVRLAGNGYSVTLTDSAEDLHRQPGGGGWGMAPVVNSWFEGAGDGDFLRGTRRVRRELRVPVAAFGDTRQEVEDAVRRLVRVIRSPFTVYVDRADGSTFSIGAVYDSGLEGVYNSAPDQWTDFTVVFKCPDPYWTSEAAQSVVIAPVPANAPFIPQLAGLHVASAAAFGTVIVNNVGDVESRPRVEVQGPGTGLAIAVNGQGLVLNKTLSSSDKVFIEFSGGGWTIKDQNGANLYASLGPAPVFPVFPPGNSSVTAAMAGTGVSSYIRFVYPERREVVY